MSLIDYNTAQLIVENNMRNAGLKGNYENGWLQTITVGNNNIQQPFNLQGLRDIIAKSIIDILTNAQATGTISNANIGGQPEVIQNTASMNIMTDSSSLSSPAARVGDSTQITLATDPVFITWVTTISTAVNTLSSGSVPIIPTSATGEVTSGSASIKIGN